MKNTRVDRAFKLIHAPEKDLYYALLKSSMLIQWLPPEGMTGEVNYFDPQTGGEFKITLKYDDEEIQGKTDDSHDVVKGKFVDMIPHKKIVMDVVFESDQPEYGGVMRQVWQYEKRSSGTMVSIECFNVPEGISQDDHETGLNASLNNLEQFIVK
ncbi:SRPBCC domain-containing protein [Corticicoccus populi]|uniref:SRPBCC domain-containing protein n=1 Tax=Corticicoccus populi TaxID=1812821 RepID=A0ABW5WVB3_9STAP